MKNQEIQKAFTTVVSKMVTNYHDGHESQLNPLPSSHKRIFRGRSVTIASKFEELVAREILGLLLHKKRRIYIDKSLTLENSDSERKETAYPDIMILDDEKNCLTGIIELKVDLGWLDTTKWLPKQSRFKRKLNKAKLSIDKKPIEISKNCPIITIILTEENDHGDRWKTIQKNLKGDAFVLLARMENRPHPNERDNKKKWSPKQYRESLINDGDFKKATKALKKKFGSM
jgi:hypothetical protein